MSTTNVIKTRRENQEFKKNILREISEFQPASESRLCPGLRRFNWTDLLFRFLLKASFLQLLLMKQTFSTVHQQQQTADGQSQPPAAGQTDTYQKSSFATNIKLTMDVQFF